MKKNIVTIYIIINIMIIKGTLMKDKLMEKHCDYIYKIINIMIISYSITSYISTLQE